MPNTSADREAMARQNGFNSYEEMRAFYMRRANPTGGVIIKGASTPAPRPVAPPPPQRSAWNPMQIFDYIGSVLSGANK